MNDIVKGLDGLPLDEMRAVIRRRIEADLPHIEDANERHQRERFEMRRRETDTRREAEQATAQRRAQAGMNEADMRRLIAAIDQLVEVKVEARIEAALSESLLGDAHSELLSRLLWKERARTSETIDKAVVGLRAEVETRIKSSAGQLPLVRQWRTDAAALPGELWTCDGSLWQCRVRTGQRPDAGDHWSLLARAGRDAPRVTPRGQWDERKAYAVLDLVNHRDNSYLATRDHPGKPGSGERSGWQVVAARGERGPQGPRGHRGAQGKTEEPTSIVQWLPDPAKYRVSPLFSNAEVGAPLELKSLFAQFLEETS